MLSFIVIFKLKGNNAEEKFAIFVDFLSVFFQTICSAKPSRNDQSDLDIQFTLDTIRIILLC